MRISREGNLVTLINVFETKPEQQQARIDAWLRFVESVKEEQGLSSLASYYPSIRLRLWDCVCGLEPCLYLFLYFVSEREGLLLSLILLPGWWRNSGGRLVAGGMPSPGPSFST